MADEAAEGAVKAITSAADTGKIGGKVFLSSIDEAIKSERETGNKPSNQFMSEKIMKKLFPIVTSCWRCSPALIGKMPNSTDAPNTEESAKTADEENPADGELRFNETEGGEKGELKKHRLKSTPATLLG